MVLDVRGGSGAGGLKEAPHVACLPRAGPHRGQATRHRGPPLVLTGLPRWCPSPPLLAPRDAGGRAHHADRGTPWVKPPRSRGVQQQKSLSC